MLWEGQYRATTEVGGERDQGLLSPSKTMCNHQQQLRNYVKL